MNKSELIGIVAEKMGVTKKEAEVATNAFVSTVLTALAEGRKIQLVGFGTFEVKERAARKGRNPQTGKEMILPGRKVPVFKAGKSLKDAVNK
ncbi:HU family DNA-binding protein [Ligilactobacillus salivarius]|uniref:HU family DNA-binding protein n=1 Tax=Ligilactobacillus salivarius TaxID=1624 RepID=UPI0039938A71